MGPAGNSHVVKVRVGRAGRIINDNGVNADVLGGGHRLGALGRPAVALSWVSTDARVPDTSFEGFFRLNAAESWADFREALRYMAWK